MQNIYQKTKTSYSLILGAFSLLCLSFSPLLFNFIWGNHDWNALIFDTNIFSGLVEGRSTQFIIPDILLSGKILPIFNMTIGFLIYISALIILSKYFFESTSSSHLYSISLISVATLPFITEPIFFQFIILSILSWPLVITFSLICAKKAATTHPIFYTFLSTLLLFIALSGYPASCNFFITAVCCKLLEERVSSLKALKELFIKTLPFAISLLISLYLLKLSFDWFHSHHYMIENYNTKPVTLPELLKKIPNIIKIALISFVEPQPFFPPIFKGFLSIIFFYFIITYFSNQKNLFSLIINIIFLSLTLIALKFSALISHEDATGFFAINDSISSAVRTDFYSFPCFLLFCLTYLEKHTHTTSKNIISLLLMCLIWLNISLNLEFSKAFSLGFISETKLLNRITERIQENTKFNTFSFYTLVQTGEFSARPRYYNSTITKKHGFYTLNTPLTRFWLPDDFYNFYTEREFVKSGNSIDPKFVKKEMIDFLTYEIKPWPHEDSLYLDDNICILGLDKKGISQIKEQLSALQGTNL